VKRFIPKQFMGETRGETVASRTIPMVRLISMVSRKFKAAIHLGLAATLPLILVALVYGSGSVTSPRPANATDIEREAIAQRFVTQALATWQDRLNLKDWDIKVDLVRPSALEPKTLGNIHWDTNTRQASIGVLSAYDYTLPTPAMLEDMEFTVVHELIHLHLASLPRSDASRGVEERAVNELARALLRLAKR
jgi:hypothetical protein